MSNRPKIRIHPKHTARIKSGSPWVYSNEVLMEPRTKSIPPGTLVDVISEQGDRFGTAYFNPHSLISARVLSFNPDEAIDQSLFAAKLQSARRLRDRIIGSPYYRLVHADADGCPGLIIDRFDDVFVAQSGTTGMDALEKFWLPALTAEFAPRAVFIKSDAPSRTHEGLKEDLRCVHGNETSIATVVEAGIKHSFAPLEGQKTGWFYDQRDNRQFLVDLGKDASVLDAFSYTGALALGALNAGAKWALLLDASKPALERAEATAKAHDLKARAEFRRCDAMLELEAMAPIGRHFDIVSCDPPAFVRAKKDLESGARGYRKLARLCANLVSSGGFLCIASCSHGISLERFQQECAIGIARTSRSARLIRSAGASPDHPVHPMLPETSYLKSLVYQLD